MHTHHENRPSRREIAVKSGLIFAVLLVASLLVAVLLYFNEQRVQIALLENSQRQHVDGLREIVDTDLQAVASDLMILVKGKTLDALLAFSSPAALENLAGEFQLVANQKRLYDQIRYIREDGQEIVRVNLRDGGAEVVSQENLQSKIARYYFKQTLQLDRDEIYVSPFDLNVENGLIELPRKPTIRFGTPAFDAGGRKRGVVMVNYLGERLLEKLDDNAGAEPGQILLLNADGFWLKGGGEEGDWAFMYEGDKQPSFAGKFPEIWSQLVKQETGQIRDSAGLFTFAAVYPAEQLRDAAPKLAAAPGDHWLLVSHVSPQQLAARSNRVLLTILSMLAGVAVPLAVVSWLLGRSLVIQRETRRRLAEQQRLAAIGAAMTALAHESRNALQRSQAGLEMLARRLPPGEEMQQLLDEVQDAQYHLRDLYEQARDWAAPLTLQPETVDLGQLATTVWQQLAHDRQGRDDSLAIDLPQQAAICQADRRMVSQVLRNVFENSLAAANPVHLQLRSASNGSANDMVRISIVDDGPGLTAEQERRIFEPFYTTRMRGTGLGMAISRRIIEAHGGSIEAHNLQSPNHPRGTEVILELPRATA
jgi:signal transduction histidine kinase